MRRTLLASLVVLLLATAQAHATPIVTNGSFELGADGLSGWTVTGSHAGFSAIAIYYGAAAAYPRGAFGEALAPNTLASNAPEAVGSRAAYFVDDFANALALSQQVYLLPGLYEVGFDAYAPSNGYRNAGDASFAAVIAGVPLANYRISGGPAATWQHFSAFTEITMAGLYDLSFTFDTASYPSKDIVIDRVYIVGNPGGEAVNTIEPTSAAILGMGLLALGALRRRGTPV